MATRGYRESYGEGRTIDTTRPFDVSASVETSGALRIELLQAGRTVTSFDPRVAGNGRPGVPLGAKQALLSSMGKL